MSDSKSIPMTDEQRDRITLFRDALTEALETNDLCLPGYRSISIEFHLKAGQLARWTLTADCPDRDENGQCYIVK